MPSVVRGSDNFDSDIHQGIGVNQTWQDVLSSRSIGVTYTNNTGKPIFVNIRAGTNSTDASGLQVNGLTVITAYVNAGGAGIPLTAIVPPGSTYQLFAIAGSISITNWAELR